MNKTPGLESVLIDHFVARDVDDAVRARVLRIWSMVRIERLDFDFGPIRQALIFVLTDPMPIRHGNEYDRGCAFIRLHLQNGKVFGLKIMGNLAAGLASLETLGAWLSEHKYDEILFDEFSACLTREVNAGQIIKGLRFAVVLERCAAVSPSLDSRLDMARKIALAAWNSLLADEGLHPVDKLPHAIANHFAEVLSSERGHVQSFIARLDQNALETMGYFCKTYGKKYHDLCIYNFFAAADPTARRNRSQAVLELPWLLRVLSGLNFQVVGPILDSRRLKSSNAAKEIIGAIDSGKPLFEAVANALNVPKETVRWTHYKILPNIHSAYGWQLDILLKLVSWMPQEKRPSTPLGWESMLAVYRALSTVFVGIYGNDAIFLAQTPAERCCDRFCRCWVAELLKHGLCEAKNTIDQLQMGRDELSNMADYLAVLQRSLYRFCETAEDAGMGDADPYKRLLLDWVGKKSLRELISVSRKWHIRLDQFLQQSELGTSQGRGEEAISSWPPVLDMPALIDGCKIIELTSPKALIAEGKAMRHCVGSSSDRCEKGESLIFSIMSIDGANLSTAELWLKDYPLRVQLCQHRSHDNNPASVHCQAVVDKLILLLNRPEQIRNLRKRYLFQKLRRHRRGKRMDRESTAEAQYRVVEETAAWFFAFGQPPRQLCTGNAGPELQL